jgi:hypothetical protein
MKTTRNLLTPARFLAVSGLLLLCVRASAAQFADVTTSAGISYENGSCYSAAWGDYNNDQFIDLYIAVGADSARVNALYRNNGNGTFTRVTTGAGPIVTDSRDSFGCAWIDFNNDGNLDMFVVNGGWINSRNDLYWNNGDGTFRSGNAGDLTQLYRFRSCPAFADYDGDGRVDIYLGEAYTSSGTYAKRLYRNTGSGAFTSIDLPAAAGYNNAAVWGDYDNDGDPDLLICNGYNQSVLWRNDGRGRFTAVNKVLPISSTVYHAAWGDYDRDGDLDIALCTLDNTLLYRNQGSNFVWVTALAGNVAVPAWADYDNDGFLDLVISGGQNTPRRVALYHNNGNGTLTSVADVFTAVADNWLACPWGDFDNDGFLDLLLTHQSGRNRLYRNLGNTNHWIKLRLVGTTSNRDAIGAKARVQATISGQSVWQMQEVNGGYMMQNDTRLNFGLGDATNVTVLRIEWPSGTVQEIPNLPANQIISITEPRRPVLAVGVTPTQVTVTLKGDTNQVYQILGSDDLGAGWTVLTNATTDATGTACCADPGIAPQSCRFYKAVRTP